MARRGLGREQVHDVAWGRESYPHPLVSCLMPWSALLAITAVLIIGFQLWQWSLPHDVPVPAVEGLQRAEAERELRHAGLRVQAMGKTQISETIPAGTVVSTNPPGGRRVKAGRTVRLVVSAGSAYSKVPDIRELTLTAAYRQLGQAGLTSTNEEYIYHATIPFDRVISISPNPGIRIKRGSTVSLKISKGAQPEENEVVTETRSSVLTVDIPQEAEGPAEVRIDVTDDDGKRTPQWAALCALANAGRANRLTGTSSPFYTLGHPSNYLTNYIDIMSGSNGFPATTGYDLVTGIGSPIANVLVPNLMSLP